MRRQALFLMAALLLAPLSASAGTVCPMMNKPFTVAQTEAFSAQRGGCCPQGTCDCSIEAAAPFPGVPAAHRADAGYDAVSAGAVSSDLSSYVLPDDPSETHAEESPPGPDKPYKLTAQYRI